MVTLGIKKPAHLRSVVRTGLLLLALVILTISVGLGIVYFALQGSVLGVVLSALIPGFLIVPTLPAEAR